MSDSAKYSTGTFASQYVIDNLVKLFVFVILIISSFAFFFFSLIIMHEYLDVRRPMRKYPKVVYIGAHA